MTGTTEDTGTTAWIKGLRVLRPLKKLRTTEDKSRFRHLFRAISGWFNRLTPCHGALSQPFRNFQRERVPHTTPPHGGPTWLMRKHSGLQLVTVPAIGQPVSGQASRSGHATGQRSGLAPGEGSGHRPAAPGEGFTVPPAQAMPSAIGHQSAVSGQRPAASRPATILATSSGFATGQRPGLQLVTAVRSCHQPPAIGQPVRSCTW